MITLILVSRHWRSRKGSLVRFFRWSGDQTQWSQGDSLYRDLSARAPWSCLAACHMRDLQSSPCCKRWQKVRFKLTAAPVWRRKVSPTELTCRSQTSGLRRRHRDQDYDLRKKCKQLQFET